MTNQRGLAEPTDRFPPNLAVIMRREVPSLTTQIVNAISERFPEYARPLDERYGEVLHLGVSQALESFIDTIADPTAPRQTLRELFGNLGRGEAQEGRSLDTLQRALRLGTCLAWDRLERLATQYKLSPTVISGLAERAFRYTDELATLAEVGYQQVHDQSAGERDRGRRRLAELIVADPPVSWPLIAEQASRVRWQIPGQITPVAVRAMPAAGDSGPRDGGRHAGFANAEPPRCLLQLGDAVLTDFSAAQWFLLFPGPLTEADHRALERLPAGLHSAIGLTVAMESAGDSLRWARVAVTLCQSEVLGTGPVIRCDDHVKDLQLLLSDERLANVRLARYRELLARLGKTLGETLTALLRTGGNVGKAAELLSVHEQTVRYRRRAIVRKLGRDPLADPGEWSDLEQADRLSCLRQAQGRQDDSTTQPMQPGNPPAASSETRGSQRKGQKAQTLSVTGK